MSCDSFWGSKASWPGCEHVCSVRFRDGIPNIHQLKSWATRDGAKNPVSTGINYQAQLVFSPDFWTINRCKAHYSTGRFLNSRRSSSIPNSLCEWNVRKNYSPVKNAMNLYIRIPMWWMYTYIYMIYIYIYLHFLTIKINPNHSYTISTCIHHGWCFLLTLRISQKTGGLYIPGTLHHTGSSEPSFLESGSGSPQRFPVVEAKFLEPQGRGAPTWCPRKLGSMVSIWVITYLHMGYIGVIVHSLTIY